MQLRATLQSNEPDSLPDPQPDPLPNSQSAWLDEWLLAQARAAAPAGRISAALRELRSCLRRARGWRAERLGPSSFRVRPRRLGRQPRARDAQGVSLWRLAPLEASCACLEFAHLRLGVCVHVGAALHALARRPRQLERALAHRPPPPRGPTLRWRPLLPEPGADPAGLARVRLLLGRDRRRNRPCGTLVERWLEPRAEAPAVLQPRPASLASPTARSGLVHALARARRVIARRAARGGAGSASDWALARLLADELHRLVQVTTQARSDARASRVGALPAEARAFLAAGHAAFERADDPARRAARAAARRLWRTGHVGRGLVVAPAGRLGAWERRWPARLPLERLEGRAGLVRGFLLLTLAEARRHAKWLTSWEPDLVLVEAPRRGGALPALPQASWRLALLPRETGAVPEAGARQELRRWLDPWSTAPRWWSEPADAARGAA